MTAIALQATPAPPRTRRGGRRERPLLAAGLALVTVHLLDLAISGPDTSWLGVLAIVAVPAGWYAASPRLLRPTRIGLAVAVGLLSIGFGVTSHGLHVVNSGLDTRDVTGLGLIAGGLLLVASAVSALAGVARPRFRPVRALAWLVGAFVVVLFVLVPLFGTLLITHAPRWAIQESSLGIPHEEVRIGDLSAWWVPPRNGASLLLMHGSGGSRERVSAHIRMLVRHGYGVLALDLPGNGESEGHSNGLGDNAQPAVDAALAWLSRRSDRVGGYGLSLGAEVLLEAAAREPRLRAVVADGAGRPRDADEAAHADVATRLSTSLQLLGTRAVSGMRTSGSLNPLVGRIAPRPVLLVASGGFPAEIPANRVYHERGPSTTLWELPEAAHTGGLRTRPVEYERRVTAFLDRALAP
jgi:pimeloyl-ACP methyl ester carboxylesterase